MNMFDMLTNAQDGNAVVAMARQFGLSESQTKSAIEALMPAFSTGFKRNASDPYGLGGFMQAIASGNHGKYYDDLSNAFAPQGIDEGNGILGHIFGSKEVSRAVADQAAQASGVGSEILKQMLPVIASALMGGMFKQSTGPGANHATSSNGNIFGQVIEQMMKNGMGGAPAPQPQTAPRNPSPLDNPLGQILEQMFGGGAAAPQQRQQPQNNPMDNPLGKIFEEMMRGGGQAAPAPEPAPRQQRNPYEDLFGEMFETGRKGQDQYRQSMEQIFDQYLQGMRR